MTDNADKPLRIPRKLDGTVLTLADLPPATWPKGVKEDRYRWVAEDKANVVQAVRSGLLSRSAAFTRYRLSDEEYVGWEQAAHMHGRLGLQANSLRGVKIDEHNNPKRTRMEKIEGTSQSGPFTLHVSTRRITCGDFEEHLLPGEWKIFQLLILHKGQVVSPDIIEREIGRKYIKGSAMGTLASKLRSISGNKRWIDNARGKGWLYNGAPLIEE